MLLVKNKERNSTDRRDRNQKPRESETFRYASRQKQEDAMTHNNYNREAYKVNRKSIQDNT